MLKGGTGYMGVEDDGTVTGCNRYDAQKIMESGQYGRVWFPIGFKTANHICDWTFSGDDTNANKIVNVQVGLLRLEVEDFLEKVFQEALLNALSHRDYLNLGAVYVKHYSDRIVIENPGAFPEEVNEKI